MLRETEVDAVFLDIRMPGLTGLELARVLAPVQDARRRSCSSPRTTSTRSTRSTSARSTTCSSRCARSGSPRRCAGWSERPRPRRTAPARRRADPGRARRRDPVRQPRATIALRRGAGRLRPAAHRRRQPPGAGPAGDARGGAGPRPASSASTARCWSRCAHIDEVRLDAGRCTVASSATSELPVSRRHTRELRDLLVRRATGRERDDLTGRPGAGPGHRPAATSAAGPRAPAPREIDEQTAARRGLRALAAPRASCGWRSRSCVALVVLIGGLPLLFALAAGARGRRGRSGSRSPWLLLGVAVYPVLFAARLALRARWPSATSATSPTSWSGVTRDERRLRRRRDRRWSPSRRWSIGTFGLRVSRTTSDFFVASRTVSPRLNASAIGGEYLSAASFLGVAGLVLAYGADMLWYPVGLTAGYLVLLVLVAAPLRRSGAYTLPDFAEARLGSRRVRRVSLGARRRDRLALPGAAVPGRRADAAARHRRAALGRRGCVVGGRGARSTCSPAGCARSPSCRPSSTG